MTRGLVIGKFYPPHRGHHDLIRTAAEQVKHLDVIVCWKEEQAIGAEQRVRWLQEVHADQGNIQLHSVWDFGDDDNSEAWARQTVKTLGYAPDVVFTSEDYGPRFAGYLGAQHVMVDRARTKFPVSSSAVRHNPLRCWEYLEPPVRAWYALRVTIVGAESTGTTTLARGLAEHYRTQWVAEYGREYCERFVNSGEPLELHRWSTDEFVHIARIQSAREDEAARCCNRIVICDTDVLATGIWHERYMGYPSPEVRSMMTPSRYALYILTDDDIPFVQDGLRDGHSIRHWMTQRFEQELNASKSKWIAVRGSHQQRMQRATEAIDASVNAYPVQRMRWSYGEAAT